MAMSKRARCFEWKFGEAAQVLSTYRFSSKFQFFDDFGHFLSLKRYGCNDFGVYSMFRLCGCPNPLKKCAPCFYTMSLINSDGIECFITRGRMQRCSTTALMVVTENTLIENFRKGPLTVRFSWFEDKGLCEKEVQTEPVNFADDLQSTSRPEVCEISYVRVMNNTGGLESTQTEVSGLSSTKDLDNTEEHPSLDPYIPCKLSRSFLETSSIGNACLSESKVDATFFMKEGKILFPVHRVILPSSSAVLFTAYYLEIMDSNNEDAKNSDADETSFSDSLCNLYTGKLQGLTANTAIPMFKMADKHNLIQVRDICMNFLMGNLTIGNICEAAIMSDTLKEKGLRNKVVQFIAERLEELQEIDTWKEFVNTNPLLASKLLSSALIANKNVNK